MKSEKIIIVSDRSGFAELEPAYGSISIFLVENAEDMQERAQDLFVCGQMILLRNKW